MYSTFIKLKITNQNLQTNFLPANRLKYSLHIYYNFNINTYLIMNLT